MGEKGTAGEQVPEGDAPLEGAEGVARVTTSSRSSGRHTGRSSWAT